MRKLEEFLRVAAELADEPPGSSQEAVEVRQPEKSSTTAEILEAVDAALSKKGAPVPLSALFEMVLDHGITIIGKNPRNNLGAKLSADPRFKSIKDLGWWYANDPVPEGVLPAHDDSPLDIGDEIPWSEPKNAEGLNAEAERPSHLNGATGLHATANGSSTAYGG